MSLFGSDRNKNIEVIWKSLLIRGLKLFCVIVTLYI
jgi:hypothetical protein